MSTIRAIRAWVTPTVTPTVTTTDRVPTRLSPIGTKDETQKIATGRADEFAYLTDIYRHQARRLTCSIRRSAPAMASNQPGRTRSLAMLTPVVEARPRQPQRPFGG